MKFQENYNIKFLQYFSLLLILNLISLSSWSQIETLNKAPKQISFSVGYLYILSNDFDSVPSNGLSGCFDYGWQLSGFHSNRKSFISVPFVFKYLPSTSSDERNSFIYSYGWAVRHELIADKKTVPFIGYALLLNQMSEHNVKGGIIGHQTRFEIGANHTLKPHFILYIKGEYNYNSYRMLHVKNSLHMQIFELKVGCRF